MLELIGELLFWREDYKFSKRKKARRVHEKENKLPKTFMIHPVWKLLGIILIVGFIGKLLISYFYVSDYGNRKTTQNIEKIEMILAQEKSALGIYPEKLNSIKRNNPLRKNITTDYWQNEFYYQQLDSGQAYLLISKGNDGILKTKDDLKGMYKFK